MRGKGRWLAAFFCLSVLCMTPLLSGFVINLAKIKKKPVLAENMEKFRQMEVAAERLKGYREWGEKEYFQLAREYLYYDGKIKKHCKKVSSFSWYSVLMPDGMIRDYAKTFQVILSDIRCFPVAKDPYGKESVYYEDSWGNSRNYGGRRLHEGTDIMTSNNVPGYFPIVSVCDGVVEKKGWLRLGGYRLGIRASGGAYFYYAHLASYADGIEQGSVVKAGQVIGYMGNTGYGKEGTVGKFDVHLHFGIYITAGKKEVSINPFEVLRLTDKIRI